MLQLPDFPWDSLQPYAERARAHPGGIVDLSVGSPVDPAPRVIREALSAATDAHAYPLTAGSVALRQAIIDWYARRRGVEGLGQANVLPTIGSKEFIAGLPLWLGIGPGDVVVQPTTAYPTYALGATLVGARVHAGDDPAGWPDETRLVWLNSPGNPDGRVLGVDQLAAAVARARELGAVIAGDECYAEFGWQPTQIDRPSQPDRPTPSILDPEVLAGSRRNVLSVYSLSKQSNLAGYRAGMVAGCSEIIARLLAVRKHIGLIPPAPVQAAMIAALTDDEHVSLQREVYRVRRLKLMGALQRCGFRIDHSEAGLYLWATRGEDAWVSVAALADLGILVTPGSFYGESGSRHIRVALTATDDRVDAAVERLSGDG